jgi:hypothetical protein
MKYLKLFENFTGKISENLQYHIDNNKPVVENIFRPGSNQYFNLIKEAGYYLIINKSNYQN